MDAFPEAAVAFVCEAGDVVAAVSVASVAFSVAFSVALCAVSEAFAVSSAAVDSAEGERSQPRGAWIRGARAGAPSCARSCAPP